MKGDERMNDEPVNKKEQEEAPVELTELFIQKKKTVTFFDTLTIQAILCVAAAIVFVVINIFNNDLAYDIYSLYSEKSLKESNIADTFRIIIDFLRSASVYVNV